MSNKEVLLTAIHKYGTINQIIKTIEELGELQQALSRSVARLLDPPQRKVNLSYDLKNIDNLFEEMADVEIMLEQCKMLFQCSAEVEEWKQKKINRLKERLENDNT